jgi:hypothetical protein
MPHEDPALVEGASVENGVFSSVTPLSPTLSAKLKAKKLSRRKIGKVRLLVVAIFGCIIVKFKISFF